MMRSVAPFWDGNETWLVLGGGGLFVAFPRAYAVIMPAFYLPVIVMLLALVFRGVAFEFRTVSRSKTWLNVAFAAGSTLAAFAQGIILGGLIQGVTVRDGAYAGGALDWATPFAFLCGLGDDRRLRAARRHLADDEDGRPGGGARARPSQDAAAGRAALHGRGQPVDAAGAAAHRGALVLAAEFLFPVAGAGGDRARGLRLLALAREGPRSAAVPGGDRAVSAWLSRPGDFQLPLSGAARRSRCGRPPPRPRARSSCCSARWCCCR